jgi:hypothetical protein
VVYNKESDQSAVEKHSKLILEYEKQAKEQILEDRQEVYMGEIHYLPMTMNDQKALINEAARSSLFSVRDSRKPRHGYTNKPIYCVGKETIEYAGVELRAIDDEPVWALMLSYASEVPLGEWIEFTPRQACLDLKWSIGGKNYEKLRDCLTRLRFGGFSIFSPRFGEWSGTTINLIDEFEWRTKHSKETLPKYRIKVHPVFERFFGKNYALLDWDNYLLLKPVERRIYDYYRCHKKPNPLTLETLKKMCDSDATAESWRKLVIRSLKKLGELGLCSAKVRRGVIQWDEGCN